MYFRVRPFLPTVVTGSIRDEMQQVISGEALVLLCTTWVVLLSGGENHQRTECHNFFFRHKKWAPRVFVRNYLLLSLNIDLSTQCQGYNTSVLGEKLSWLNACLISPHCRQNVVRATQMSGPYDILAAREDYITQCNYITVYYTNGHFCGTLKYKISSPIYLRVTMVTLLHVIFNLVNIILMAFRKSLFFL